MLTENDYNWLRKLINNTIKSRWINNVVANREGIPCFYLSYTNSLYLTRDYFWNRHVLPPLDKLGNLSNEQYKEMIKKLWTNNRATMDNYILEFLTHNLNNYSQSAKGTPVGIMSGEYRICLADSFDDAIHNHTYKVYILKIN